MSLLLGAIAVLAAYWRSQQDWVDSVSNRASDRPAAGGVASSEGPMKPAGGAPLVAQDSALGHDRIAVPGDRHKLRISLIDQETKAVCPALKVWLAGGALKDTRQADDRGQVDFDLADGVYGVNIIDPGFAGADTVHIDGSAVETVLLVRNLSWNLRGHVLDESGLAVAHARVRIFGVSPPRLLSVDADGAFTTRIPGEVSGVSLVAWARGFVARRDRVARGAGASDIVLTLKSAEEVALNVKRSDGTPLPGCAVLVQGLEADTYLTNESGDVVLDCVDPSKDVLYAKLSLRGYERKSIELRHASPSIHEFVLHGLSHAWVRAVDSRGAGLPEIELRLVDHHRQPVWVVATNDEGRAKMEAPPGHYEITAAGRWLPAEKVHLDLGDPQRIRETTVVFQESARLTGRIVVAGDLAEPVPGALLEATTPWGLTAGAQRSRDDGTFDAWAPDGPGVKLRIKALGFLDLALDLPENPANLGDIAIQRDVDGSGSLLFMRIVGLPSDAAVRVRLVRGIAFCHPLGPLGGRGVLVGAPNGECQMELPDVAPDTSLIIGVSAEGLAERICAVEPGVKRTVLADLSPAISIVVKVSPVRGDSVISARLIRECQGLGEFVAWEGRIPGIDGVEVREVCAGERVKAQGINAHGEVVAESQWVSAMPGATCILQ